MELHGELLRPEEEAWDRARPLVAAKEVQDMDLIDRGDMLRSEDAARVLGIGRTKLYEMIRRGELPALRIGRLIRIPRSTLTRWVEANTRGIKEVA